MEDSEENNIETEVNQETIRGNSGEQIWVNILQNTLEKVTIAKLSAIVT